MICSPEQADEGGGSTGRQEKVRGVAKSLGALGGSFQEEDSGQAADDGGDQTDLSMEMDWQDWQWDLMNHMPHDRATRILQIVEQAKHRSSCLQSDLEAQLLEVARLGNALQELREESAQAERRLTRENAELVDAAAAARGREEVAAPDDVEAELAREREARVVAERRADQLEASTAELQETIRLQREALERYAALDDCVRQARTLEAEAVPAVPGPPSVGAAAAGEGCPLAVEIRALLAREGPEAATAEELATAVWSCGAFGCRDPATLDAIAERLASGAVADLGPRGLCDVARSFLELERHDAPLEAALASAALGRMREFGSDELLELLAVVAAQVRHWRTGSSAAASAELGGSVGSDAARAASRSLGEALAEALAKVVGGLKSQALAPDRLLEVLRALVDLGVESSRASSAGSAVLEAIASLLQPRVSELGPSGLAGLAEALASLRPSSGQSTRELVEALAPEALRQLRDFDEAELTALSCADAALAFSSEELRDGIAVALSRMRKFELLE